MTQQEINAGNELIGKFRGVCFNYGVDYLKPYTPKIEDLIFHKSWDWLIPVVEQIESMGYTVFIQEKDSCIANNSNFSIDYRNADSKIEAVWNIVIEFIKYYNNKINESS